MQSNDADVQKKLSHRYLCTTFVIEYTNMFSSSKVRIHLIAHFDLESFFCIYALQKISIIALFGLTLLCPPQSRVN